MEILGNYVLMRTQGGVWQGWYYGTRPHDGAHILEMAIGGGRRRRRYVPADVFVSLLPAPGLEPGRRQP